jgi:hypothetical protein
MISLGSLHVLSSVAATSMAMLLLGVVPNFKGTTALAPSWEGIYSSLFLIQDAEAVWRRGAFDKIS